ncbi:hypothetical protein ACTA71_006039 [Dictyostelium dimigraforme]
MNKDSTSINPQSSQAINNYQSIIHISTYQDPTCCHPLAFFPIIQNGRYKKPTINAQSSFRNESHAIHNNQELQLETEERSIQSHPTSIRLSSNGPIRIKRLTIRPNGSWMRLNTSFLSCHSNGG